jgi:NAD(P)-dependent dehydrogenase (short-subunit alcohol dehydrogenase family)
VNLAGKVALVTGGSRGIGAAIVRAMVAQGARVSLLDIEEAPGNKLVEDLRSGANSSSSAVTYARMIRWNGPWLPRQGPGDRSTSW